MGATTCCVLATASPGDWGPRRVTQDEIRASLADGWVLDSIEPVTIDPSGAQGWQVGATRV